MLALGWGLAATFGAVAGLMVAPILTLDPNMMGGIQIYAFAAATLGGFTSPLGAVVGGFLVGIVENLVGTYVSFIGTELKLTVALAMIIVVLPGQAERAVRPRPRCAASSHAAPRGAHPGDRGDRRWRSRCRSS